MQYNAIKKIIKLINQFPIEIQSKVFNFIFQIVID